MSNRELYEKAIAKVSSLLGPEAKDLSAYRQRFEKIFDKKGWQSSHRNELLEKIESSEIVFLADFHALAQSQRGHLRILKLLRKKRKRILFVEFIEQKYQKILEQYLRNKISEKVFLEKIKWQKNWTFPWQNYRPLLEWAKQEKVPVYAVNKYIRERSSQTLKKRDLFASKQISSVMKKNPKSQALVIFGELHLAEQHLPALISKGLHQLSRTEMTLVFQNSEKLYFQVQKSGKEIQTEVLRLEENNFCVLNVEPWVKWQTYVHFLESSLIYDEEGEDADPTDLVAKYLKILGTLLKMKVKVDHFSIYRAQDSGLKKRITQKIAKELLKEGESFFLPESQLGVLSKAHENYYATMAMSILHWQSANIRTFSFESERFQILIWSSAVEYFGSKLLNPKRKTLTFYDLKEAAESQNSNNSIQIAYEYKLLEQALLRQKKMKFIQPQKAKKQTDYFAAGRILGALIGEKIYTGYYKGMISLPTIQRMLRKNPEDPRFRQFYFEVLGLIQSIPESFQKKNERL